MINKFYAIGFKHHVELRVAIQPPKAYRSALLRNVSQQVYNPGWANRGQQPYKLVDKKAKFNVVYHEGGRVIGVVPIVKFRRQAKVSIRNGQRIEVSAKVIDLLGVHNE